MFLVLAVVTKGYLNDKTCWFDLFFQTQVLHNFNVYSLFIRSAPDVFFSDKNIRVHVNLIATAWAENFNYSISYFRHIVYRVTSRTQLYKPTDKLFLSVNSFLFGEMWKLRLWPQTFVLHCQIFENSTYFRFVFHWKGRGCFCFVYNFQYGLPKAI